MAKPVLSILIPAAGGSRRLGQAKQLVGYRGKPLLQRVIEITSTLAPAETIVVTGANQAAVRETAGDTTVRWVHNPGWADGIGGSIARGAARLSPRSNGVMIMLCDQYRVTRHDLQELLGAWHRDPDRIVAAAAGDRYMPPVIFPAKLFPDLGKLTGDRGAHPVIKTHQELLSTVPIANAVFDLDTPAQLLDLEASQEH